MTKPIRVAIVGVGNCASALVQGVNYYRALGQTKNIPGIAFDDIGGYSPVDIEFVVAFDVDKRKVGKTLGEAIFAEPNCARVFAPHAKTAETAPVYKGPILDGVSEHTKTLHKTQNFQPDEEASSVDVGWLLRYHQVDMVLNYLPVGSSEATEFYANEAIKAGASFVNNIPVLTLNHPDWEKKFVDAGIPYIGSDIKSQFGASILSQVLQELAFGRGMKVNYHQQLNVGGNMDFGNMLNINRLKHKKVSKENVIRAQNELNDVPVDEDSLFAGPSTFIPYLKDNKVAYFTLHMEGFGGAPVTLDAKLSVQDSENSAGVVIDAIRFLKVARELGIMGCLRGPSSFTQKSPPKQTDFETSMKECQALANRQLTDITKRQTTKEGAMEFAWEEFNNGGMSYLERI